MFWGFFTVFAPGSLIPIERIMNSNKYKDILVNYLVPILSNSDSQTGEFLPYACTCTTCGAWDSKRVNNLQKKLQIQNFYYNIDIFLLHFAFKKLQTILYFCSSLIAPYHLGSKTFICSSQIL